ncbi:DNA-binding transcription factor cat8 [Entomophthora muscae]|uniref:DNA-binding transcription factor cat8 n=1 Tax=Entomophthora muscae TaxID=34485 RepID=A0ACC2S7S1_9FUNG|nr:DNA-binding transcription factor cat8 [Entomophthora muscae]
MVVLNIQENTNNFLNLKQGADVNASYTIPENETDNCPFTTSDNVCLNKRSRACDQCSNLKVRCDKVFPFCQRCLRMGISCSWEKAQSQSYRIGRPPKKPCNKTSCENQQSKSSLDPSEQEDSDNIPISSKASKKQKHSQPFRKTSMALSSRAFKSNMQFSSSSGFAYLLPTYISLVLSSNLIGHTKFFLRLESDCIYIGNSPVSYHLSWYPQSLRALASLASPENLISSGLLPKPKLSLFGKSACDQSLSSFPSREVFVFDFHNRLTLDLNSFNLSEDPKTIWKLIDLYFYHFNIGYSLLSREFFNQALHSKFHAPEVRLLLNAVLMSACGFLSDPVSSLKLSQIYTSRVLVDLTRLCRRPCLEVVQALILLSRFPATIQADQISHRSWYFHSLACAMAKSLGLNLSCKRLKSDLYEARKKTWWILYTNDVLFRLHMNKHPQLFWSDAFIAMPTFHSHLYSSTYQTGILSEQKRRSFHPTPGLSHLSVLIRIRYFLIADVAVELHNQYRSILCPPSCRTQIQVPRFPFSWNLSEQVVNGPEYTKFLRETKHLEARLFNWFRWSFGNLLSICLSTYTFEVPSSQDYFSLLSMLHFAYLLVELYRPFSSAPFEQFEQLPDIPHHNLQDVNQLSETEKCWFGCRLGASSILARKAEFLEVGISGKWVWIQSFFLGLFNGGAHDQDLAMRLMDLTEHGAQRFALAADVLALMRKLLAAKLSGIILD